MDDIDKKIENMVYNVLESSQKAVSSMAQSVQKSEELVDRMAKLVFCIVVCGCITIFGIVVSTWAVYFCTDYQYPTVTQESKQATDSNAGAIKQEVKQEIKKGDD